MKIRGAGWILGSALTLTAFATVAACDDADSANIGFDFDGGSLSLPDGGGFDARTDPQDGNVTPIDAGGDSSQPEASVPAQCNDGHVDMGETCDPLATCPTECAPDGCNLKVLENAGTCAAVCTTVAVQSECANNDGCCPASCNVGNDNDCTAACGNGALEPGEKCDGADCPTDCPPIGCMVRKLVNGGTCQAECVDAQTPITTCGAVADGGGASDNCCPSNCSQGNDPDCAAGACGNGLFEPPGETCDTGIASGNGSCPTTCAPQGCNLFKLDKAGTCQAACVPDGTVSACVNGDGCCAPGCNNTNDSDCAPSCGNGVTEPPTETCDANCPKDCPQNVCQLFTLQNAGTCTATCTPSGTVSQCINGDGCCPPSCTNATDSDCPVQAPTCGNGKLDTGETCDPSAGVACPVCNTGTTCLGQTGNASTCNVRCDVPITKCSGIKSDACCPFAVKDGSDCMSKTDSDCNGSAWQFVSLQSLITFKDTTDCHDVTIDGIVQGGSYDVTTCSPDAVATGDVVIKSVVGSSVVKVPPAPAPELVPSTIDYGSNDNCLDEKLAIPYRAGWTCNNKDGKPTMACVAEGTGGFVAKNASAITVTICAVKAAAAAPFAVWYNATTPPKLSVK